MNKSARPMIAMKATSASATNLIDRSFDVPDQLLDFTTYCATFLSTKLLKLPLLLRRSSSRIHKKSEKKV
jgi:hypothetical protein